MISSVGLNTSLMLGAQSMDNQQVAINTVGNNISNINTPGYARQQAIFAPAVMSGPNGEMDYGATISSIESLRSPLLDGLVQQSLSSQGYADNNANLTSTIENALGEQFTANSSSSSSATAIAGSGPVQTALTNFFGALQSLAASPSNATARQQVTEDAQTLTTSIKDEYQTMQQTQSSIASSATGTVNQINQLSQSIAQLNQQIIEAQAASGNANELTDERTADVEQLSSLINVTTSPQANGSITVALADNPGVVLVSGDNSNGTGGTQSLSVAYNPNSAVPLIVSGSTSGALGTGIPSSGSLGAELNVVNNVIGSPAAAGDTGILGALDGVASQLITLVNTQNAAGYDLNDNPGGAIFTGSGAGTIGVSAAVANDPSLIAAGNGSGPLDGSNAQAMADLQGNAAIIPAFQTMVSGLGETVSTAATTQTTQDQITQQLKTQRDSVSGVSIDEEMTNLINFQQAYAASGHFVSTIASMYNSLLSIQTN